MSEFEFDVDSLLNDLDDVEPSQGLVSEELKPGRYHMKVDRILAKDTNKAGDLARARVMYRALKDGVPYGAPVFDDWYLGASRSKAEADFAEGTGVKDKDGNVKYQSAAEMYAGKQRNALGRVKGFMNALGVGRGGTGVGLDGVFLAFNVDEWVGKEFVGTVRLSKDWNGNPRTQVSAYYAVDDPKHGLASLK